MSQVKCNLENRIIDKKYQKQHMRFLKEADAKGTLEAGKDADFVVLDDDFNVLLTYREGKCIYDHEKDTDLYNWEFLNQITA